MKVSRTFKRTFIDLRNKLAQRRKERNQQDYLQQLAARLSRELPC